MKFRLFATVAVWLFCLFAACTRALSIFTAAAFAVVIAAALASPRSLAGCLSTCPSVFQSFRFATDNLANDIHKRSVFHSMWLNAIPRVPFTMNAGATQNTFVVGNSEPTSNNETWDEVTQSGQTFGAGARLCNPTFTEAQWGYNEYTYNPRRFSLSGPVICREELMFAHNPTQFMRVYKEKLGHRAKRSLEFQFRKAYTAIADKAVAGNGQLLVTEGASGLTTLPVPASALTFAHLDQAALRLNENGAGDADNELISLGSFGPEYLLEIDSLDASQLFTNDSNIRDDVRNAQSGLGEQNLLFKRIGATVTHKNFRIVPTLFPTRYEWSGGTGFTEVDTWSMITGSKGKVAIVRDEWRYATYGAARIVNPAVMNARMIRPESAGLDWDPTNYMLEWVWKTGPEISESYCFDPFKNYGRHFAQGMYAPEAVFPNYGMTIFYKRCFKDAIRAFCQYPY